MKTLKSKLPTILFKQRYDLKKTLIFEGIIGVVFSLLVVPLKITVDGSLYISSAKSLYSMEIIENYHWVREPIYPMLLRFINDTFGSSDLGIIFIQSIFLMSATILVVFIFFEYFNITKFSLFSAGILFVLLINPYYLLFSGLPLQQSLFAFYLALYLATIRYAQEITLYSQLILFHISFVALFLITIMTSPAFFYLGIFVFLINTLFITTTFIRVDKRLKFFVVAIITVFMTLLVFAIGATTNKIWNDIKSSYTVKQNVESVEDFTHPLDMSVADVILDGDINPINAIPAYGKRLGALLHFNRDDTWPFSELEIYSELMLFSGWRCGAVDPFFSEPYATYSKDYFTSNCRSEELHKQYSKIRILNPYIYWLSMISIFIIITISVIRKNTRFLSFFIIPGFFLFSYAFIDAGLDRYGIPIYPWAISATLISMSSAFWARDQKVVNLPKNQNH